MGCYCNHKKCALSVKPFDLDTFKYQSPRMSTMKPIDRLFVGQGEKKIIALCRHDPIRLLERLESS